MMEFKKKLKSRLYVAVIYAAIGVIMIAGTFAVKADGDFTSAFGLGLVVAGLARIRNYFIITKNEETIRKQEIMETDERNLAIIHKARSTAFFAYVLLAGTMVIVFSLFEMHKAAQWISYSVLLLVVVYWISYWIYQKKM